MTRLQDLVQGQVLHVTSMSNGLVLSLQDGRWSRIALTQPRGVAVSPEGETAIADSRGVRYFRPDGTMSSVVFTGRIEAHDAHWVGGKVHVASVSKSSVMSVDRACASVDAVWAVGGWDEQVPYVFPVNGVSHDLRYVTVLARADAVGRADPVARANGSRVVDTNTGETVFSGLVFPHSPVSRPDGLWFLESGVGTLRHGEDVVVKFSGFARGLLFIDDRYALVGVSQGRPSGLPQLGTDPLAQPGVAVVDTVAGGVVDFVPLDVREIFALALGPSPLLSGEYA